MAGTQIDSSNRSHPEIERASGDDLVREHLPLVGYLVAEAASRLPAHVSRDDLTSAGMMALAQAARNFDADRGVPVLALRQRANSRRHHRRTPRPRLGQPVRAAQGPPARRGRRSARGDPRPAPDPARTRRRARRQHRRPRASPKATSTARSCLSLQGFSDAGTLEGMLPDQDPSPEQRHAQPRTQRVPARRRSCPP